MTLYFAFATCAATFSLQDVHAEPKMKIEFAPLSLPLQRRLQTASVVQWVFSFLSLAQCCVALFICLLFTRFWLVSALYAAWWLIDRETPHKGGRRSHIVRNSVVWRYMRDYFPITLVKTAELDPRKNYLLGFHPHGVLAVGAFLNFCTEASGFSTLLTPLVPIFSFGENELFDQVNNPKGSWLRWLQHRLQQVMGIALPLFHARGIFQYSFGLIPYRWPIYTVVGKPIPVQKKHNPSEEDVDQVHQKYLGELSKLFEEHKAKYNVPEDRHLEFI
nr:PREDICTED: 2-acylglycerol O-acyltransferase 2 [Struthio camelus australis]